MKIAGWLAALIALIGVLLGAAHHDSPDRCATFNAQTGQLLRAVQDRASYDNSNGFGLITDPQLDTLRRTYATYYLNDTTGCATPLDKAKARADLGGTP